MQVIVNNKTLTAALSQRHFSHEQKGKRTCCGSFVVEIVHFIQNGAETMLKLNPAVLLP